MDFHCLIAEVIKKVKLEEDGRAKGKVPVPS